MIPVLEGKLKENRYQRLFATANDGLFIVDATSGEFLEANPRLQQMLGSADQ